MENQRVNPLAGHFRQPAIYLKLPSRGRWWGENALNMPANGELPVFPMSAKDEIILRTPDALLNGQGLVDVIQSCCPNIQDAWLMPSIDVDAVLIAIRIATYGNSMSFDSKCPHCGESNTHEVDLGSTLSKLETPDYGQILNYKDLKIKLKPQHYFKANQTNMMEFEEQKLITLINSSDLDADAKAQQITAGVEKMLKLGIQSCAHSTEYVELADGTRVTDSDFIDEFYQNSESSVIKLLREKVAEFVEVAKPKGLTLICQGCASSYPVDLTFDYSNFFGSGF